MALSHAGVMAVILLVLGGGAFYLLSHRLYSSATSELLSAAQGEATMIQESGVAKPPPDADVPSRAAIQFAVFTPDGRQLGETPEAPAWLHPYARLTTDVRVSNEPVRVITLPVTRNGALVATVVSARSLEPEEELLHHVKLVLIAGGILAVIASLLAGWLLAGRAVRPVRRAYEAQAAFAADASHELRTPLAFIRSGVEVLAEREPVLGGDVLGEIDYLTSLTQRLLMLARAESGNLTLDRHPIDVAEICRSAVQRSRTAHGNTIALDCEGTVEATGDRFATEAALDAVLENVKVHGGADADVSVGRDDGRALISVADHGPGLPPEEIDSAFERFYRADPSRTRETGGAGLGLHLAKTLIEAEGGTMWLEETPGGGLTARIGLPI